MGGGHLLADSCKSLTCKGVGQGVGIPIGNLTSQIFANIYLNEFDRFVRHYLKPLAYVRYGDDCIIFTKTRHQARQFRYVATRFLAKQLKLTTNPKNDVIVKTSDGLHFLGHVITNAYTIVDKTTTKRVLIRVNSGNLASYKSLKLAKWPKTELDWLILDEIDDIITYKH